MRISKMLANCIVALALIFSVVPSIRAQEQTASPAPSASQSPNKTVENQRTQQGEAQAEEAEEPSEDAVFRNSGAVRLIARKTGLSIDQAFWICMVLNFILIIALLWFLLRKAVPALYRNRNEAIQRRLEEARKTSEEARKRLADVESRLSRLDTEIEQMRREAESGASTEEKRMLAAAEEERRRIVESAEQEIARAAAAARRELKAYAAELAVDLAEKRIHITEDIDHELVRDFASRLGRDGQ
jgi:F-type H+-transporting ATPase subunit b